MYAISLFGIIAIHEMGHKVATWYHKMDSSWPYFIPGIPGIWPTMGAVISARDPPINRDSLFDLGISGPVAGLAVTVIVSIAAILSAKMVPMSSFAFYTAIQQFRLLHLVSHWYLQDNFVQRSHSRGNFFTSVLCLLVRILADIHQSLPAWQLDGGHISNAAVSPKVHKWLTYISVLIMILIQFYLMAFLILITVWSCASTPAARFGLATVFEEKDLFHTHLGFGNFDLRACPLQQRVFRVEFRF